MDKTKAPYAAPKLVMLGTVADLTRAQSGGPNFDLVDFSPSIG
ncbi:MAG TPA: lasso RiPP family leader peptide-containing protein [Solirubrobacteraceae bacterium]|nr:lasso RiPP family leader peptide-containing protein [Solirubrobacteraceae bacterium]